MDHRKKSGKENRFSSITHQESLILKTWSFRKCSRLSFRHCVALLLTLTFPFCAIAEDSEVVTNLFSVIGPSNQVYQVELKNRFGTGVSIKVEPGGSRELLVETSARSLEKPIFTYHSTELGQLSIVPCWVGAGTGISITRYFALNFGESEPQLIYEGLAEYTEDYVSEPNHIFYSMRSEFRAIANGFAQIITVTHTSTPTGKQVPEIFLQKRIELEFSSAPFVDSLHFKCEIEPSGAASLAEIMRFSPKSVQSWASSVFTRISPQLGKNAADYLNADSASRSAKLETLRAAIAKHFTMDQP